MIWFKSIEVVHLPVQVFLIDNLTPQLMVVYNISLFFQNLFLNDLMRCNDPITYFLTINIHTLSLFYVLIHLDVSFTHGPLFRVIFHLLLDEMLVEDVFLH